MASSKAASADTGSPVMGRTACGGTAGIFPLARPPVQTEEKRTANARAVRHALWRAVAKGQSPSMDHAFSPRVVVSGSAGKGTLVPRSGSGEASPLAAHPRTRRATAPAAAPSLG